MKNTLFFLQIILFLSVFCFAPSYSQIYYEDFENYPNISMSSKSSYFHEDLGAREGQKCLYFEDGKSEEYSIKTPLVKVNKNNVKISFWLKLGQVDLYNFNINIKAPGTDKNFVSITEGYTWSDNTVWGTFRYVDPEGFFINLCKATSNWAYFEIDLDFENYVCDLFVNKDHIGTDLPINNLKYDGSLIFEIGGYSSKDQKGWYLDELKIEENNKASKHTPTLKRKTLELSNKTISLHLDEGGGQLADLSFMGVRLCGASKDYYKFENKEKSFWAKEVFDKVTDISSSSNKITFTCENPALPNIKIFKTYEIGHDNTVTKDLSFENLGEKGFITYKTNIDYDEDFLKNSFAEGCDFSAVMNKGEISLSYAKGYRIHKEHTYGIGIIRDRVNNRFVLNQPCDPDKKAMVMKVFSDYLESKSEGRIRLIPVKGDFTNYIQYIYNREEYKALFGNPKAPWLKDLCCDAMYLTTEGMNYEKAVAPLTVTDTIWFLNPPWGNWWADSDPPKSLHPNVRGISAERTSVSPNAKVSSYTNTLFDINSDIYKMNDEDFFVTDRDGNYVDGGVPSDSGGVKTFLLQILNPKVRKYWFEMHEDKLTSWQEHFFYMDGPGAYEELQDWKLMKVIQGYDWLDFYKELRGVIDKCAPDGKGVFFTNGFLPYSDIGYIEYRDKQWQDLLGDKWQYLAKTLLEFKLSQQKDYIICPTYGSEGAQPTINTYCICYGWLGHLPNEKFIPWHKEALKNRDNEIILTGVQNPWWRESDPQYEAYTFKRGKDIILNVINHSKDSEANISLNLKELGLSKSKNYKVSVYTMNNPLAGGEEAMTKISESAQKLRGKITVPLADKGLLTSVVISQ